jgi:hypothetical protein
MPIAMSSRYWRQFLDAVTNKPRGHEPYWALTLFIGHHEDIVTICKKNGVLYRESPTSSTEMFVSPVVNDEQFDLGLA